MENVRYHEFFLRQEGDDVRVWYASIPEYSTEDEKTMPWFGKFGHRVYARALLDVAVRDLKHANA